MKITDLSIRYRTSIVVLTVLLVVGGFIAYTTIPKESSPSIEIPNIVVTTIYPGVSPDDIETLVTQQIEKEVQNISGIKEIRSTSTEGVSTIVVEFNPDVPMDDAYQRVRDKVDLAKPNLPGDIEEPLVNEIDISQFPIMTVNLAADYSLARLKQVGEDLQDQLETIPSVLEVDLIGGLDREVQVNVDLAALYAYSLTFQDVIDAISQENTNIPGGSIDVDRLNYLVRVDGNIRDPREIESFVISAPGGPPIYVRDVAEIDFGFKDRLTYSRLQVYATEDDRGRIQRDADPQILQVISLNVKKRAGDNILDTAAEVQRVIDEFPFPSGTEVVITGDQSKFVETMVKDLENNIISGLIFVIAVLLFFLGFRAATLVGIAIPLSMFVAFLVFSAMGQTLNFVILFSLIIALGMLVDNAVVIVENIYRFREEGYSRFEAAKLGTAEVGGAVVASTATTVAAFAPMLMWPGIMGKFMSYLPLTLIITLVSSLFVALVINPVLTGIFVRLDHEKHEKPPRAFRVVVAVVILLLGLTLALANWQTLVVLAVAIPLVYFLHTRVFRPFGDDFIQTGLPRLIRFYRGFLGWMLERDYSVKRPFLRNTLALGALTLGFLLMIAAASLGAVAGSAAAVFLVPGGLMLFIGILGILIHSLESLFLGGRKSVKAGLIVGGVMLALLALIFIGPREMPAITFIEMMFMPALIVVVGMLGMAFNRGREHLILTDNRARLLTGTLGVLFGIVAMFQVAPTGVEFFPDTDPNQVRITAEAPLGTTLEASNQAATELHNRLRAILDRNPDARYNTENVVVGVGVGGDIMFGGGAAGPERTNITLNMLEYERRAEPSSVTLARLRNELDPLPDIDVRFEQDTHGPPTGMPINIEISGPDFAQIQRITREVRQELQRAARAGEISGLVDIADNLNEGRPELQVIIDRERAARFGLNTSMIASTVRSAIAGTEAGKYRDGEDEYDITVRLAEEHRQTLESLQHLTILHEGAQIPLISIASLDVTSGLGSITRLDLRRVSTVQADVATGYNAQATLGEVRAHLADYVESLPAGYTMSYTGENEEMDEAFGFLTFALLIGVGLILIILVAQFNSIVAPLIIMIAVGLSLIGVMLGLVVTRTPFGLMTFIGVISLAGIVVNNSIVLVDYTMQLRERGFSKQDAIIEAGATRLRPVLLTALTTVLGLVPLTFGLNIDFVGLLTNLQPNFQLGSENTQFWGPMGTAIIAGLTFGTFLTLVIVPVMYSAFDSLSVSLTRALTNDPNPEGIRSDVMASDRGMAHAPDEVSHEGNGFGADIEPSPSERNRD